jgi:RNase P/RNase MRP subunit POP5
MVNVNLRERWRYIAFKIEGGAKVARNDFLGALISTSRGTPLANSFRITVFEGDFGILKVPHKLKDEAIKVLHSVDSVKGAACKVATLKTSGTIRTLKEKYKEHIADPLDKAE